MTPKSDDNFHEKAKIKGPKKKNQEFDIEKSTFEEDSSDSSSSSASSSKSKSSSNSSSSKSSSKSSSFSQPKNQSKKIQQKEKEQKLHKEKQDKDSIKEQPNKRKRESNISIKRHKGEWDEEIEITTQLDFEYVSDIEIDNEDEFYLTEDGPKYAKHLNVDFYKEKKSADEINVCKRFPKPIIKENTEFELHKWKMVNILKIPFNPENAFKELFQNYNISDLIEGKGPKKSRILLKPE